MLLPMRHRRQRPEALKPVNHATWLTARDPFGTLLESRELEPFADLRAELTRELESRAADGWTIEELPSDNFAGFFCRRGGRRVLIGISPHKPGAVVVAQSGYPTW